MLIAGSEAFKRIFPNRIVGDLDIIIPFDKVELVASKYGDITRRDENIAIIKTPEKRVELLLANPNSAMWMYLERYNAFDLEEKKYMDVQGLYSIKKSHIHIPFKFDKHIEDYCLLHKEVKGKDTMPEITKQNNKDIKMRIGKRFMSPSLNKSVKEFFAQSEGLVENYFIHDDIHRVMAHYENTPLYEKMQKDLSKAWCEKDMWDTFSFEDKMKTVLEEAYVIALERKILPMIYGGKPYFTPTDALKWSMMRVCTTLTGGWFRSFATNNYIEIMAFADLDYVRKFLHKVKEGKIKFKTN